MATTLIFGSSLALQNGPSPSSCPARVVVGRKEHFAADKMQSLDAGFVTPETASAIFDGTVDGGISSVAADKKITTLGVYSGERSRNAAVVRSDSISEAVAKAVAKNGDAHVIGTFHIVDPEWTLVDPDPECFDSP